MTVENMGGLTAEDFIHQAQRMSEWFGDYIDGFIDEPPKDVSSLTRNRLNRYFPNRSVPIQLADMRAKLSQVPLEHQSNLAAYFCGFPTAILRDLTFDITLEDSQAALQLAIFDEEQSALDARVPSSTTRHGEQGSEEDLAWQSDALCAQTDPEAFFPDKGGSTRTAKKICNSCEVRNQCLAYALKNDERFGIWGGLNERERRRLSKAGGVAVADAAFPLMSRRG